MTEETLVWTVEVRREGEMRKLNMSIMKSGGMSKWRQSHRELRAADRSLEVSHMEVIIRGIEAFELFGLGGVLQGRREGWEPS